MEEMLDVVATLLLFEVVLTDTLVALVLGIIGVVVVGEPKTLSALNDNETQSKSEQP